MVRVLLLLAVLLVACDGNGSDPAPQTDATVDAPESGGSVEPTAEIEPLPSDPGNAMIRILEYAGNDQRARRWASLHPAHQEIATRSAYVNCSEGGLSISSIEVIEVFEESFPVPRLGEVQTTAVTVEVSVNVLGEERSERLTAHLVDVDDEWRWIIPAEDLDAYEAGDCP